MRRSHQFNELRRSLEETSGSLSDLLGRHSVSLDGEMAAFIKNYLRALQLDFELAMTRGEPQTLQLVVEDVRELFESTQLRLEKPRELV